MIRTYEVTKDGKDLSGKTAYIFTLTDESGVEFYINTTGVQRKANLERVLKQAGYVAKKKEAI